MFPTYPEHDDDLPGADRRRRPPGPSASVPLLPRGKLRVLALVALAAAAAAVLIIVASLVPGTGTTLAALWPFAFVLVFPVFGAALVICLRTFPDPAASSFWRSTNSNLFSEVRRWLPRPVVTALGVLIGLALVNSGLFAATMGGQPETHQGRYYANNHGVLTELTADQYDEAQRTGARGFMGHAVVFFSFSAAGLVASSRRRWSDTAAAVR